MGFVQFVIVLFCVFLSCKANVNDTSSPPEIFPTANVTIIVNNGTNLNASIAPMEFPKNTTQYKFSNNATILETLKNHTIKADIEATDMTNEDEKSMPDLETELLQPDDEDFKTEREKKVIKDHEGGRREGVDFLKNQWPALLAGVFILLAVFCYIGLYSWRKFLEQRYGTREMLINEEDNYAPNNDFRNFEL